MYSLSINCQLEFEFTNSSLTLNCLISFLFFLAQKSQSQLAYYSGEAVECSVSDERVEGSPEPGHADPPAGQAGAGGLLHSRDREVRPRPPPQVVH